MIFWIIGIGLTLSFAVAVVAGLIAWSVNRPAQPTTTGSWTLTTTDTTAKTKASDASMLNAVVDLVNDGDIQSAIEVLQLQAKRKQPTQ